MQPNKINELIPVVHEMFKQMGEWDGLPPEIDQFETVIIEPTFIHNAYLAQKLDAITYHIVMAMRERSEEIRLRNWNPKYNGEMVEHLTRSLLLTLDLMGFYRVEYKHNGMDYKNAEAELRILIHVSALHGSGVASHGMYNAEISLNAIASRLVSTAELDKIDLDWHISALINYMEQSK